MAHSILPRSGTLRLASGLLLFAFVATHLLNHSLGIISLQAMEAGREIFIAVWRSVPLTILLIAATVIHALMVLWRVFRRRSWRGVRVAELVQLGFGVAIPPLLILHVLASRGLHERYGLDDTYTWVLMALWQQDPLLGLQQAVVSVVAWGHGCIGLHYWLCIRPWYRKWQPALQMAALLLLTLGLVGFVNGGQDVAALARDPEWLRAFGMRNALPAEAGGWVYGLRDAAWTGMIGLLVLLLAARAGVAVTAWRQRRVVVTYPEGQEASAPAGLSVLEMSRRANIPHASICGGRARCSTCRVKVISGLENCPPPEGTEQRVLRGLNAPPGVRLGCQLRPTGPIQVFPLVPVPAQPSHALRRAAARSSGNEKQITILFADIRDFTRIVRSRLPYDVVFLVNQYFRAMGEVIEKHGGQIDKFMGDGIMALFGARDVNAPASADAGARAAIEAARGMAAALETLNRSLAADLGRPLRIGIGIETGTVVLGEMGYRDTMSVTAVGDPVNIASRLEEANKDHGSQLVLSDNAARAGGIAGMLDEPVLVPIRGRDLDIPAHVFRDARTLPELPPVSPSGAAGRKGAGRTDTDLIEGRS